MFEVVWSFGGYILSFLGIIITIAKIHEILRSKLSAIYHASASREENAHLVSSSGTVKYLVDDCEYSRIRIEHHVIENRLDTAIHEPSFLDKPHLLIQDGENFISASIVSKYGNSNVDFTFADRRLYLSELRMPQGSMLLFEVLHSGGEGAALIADMKSSPPITYRDIYEVREKLTNAALFLTAVIFIGATFSGVYFSEQYFPVEDLEFIIPKFIGRTVLMFFFPILATLASYFTFMKLLRSNPVYEEFFRKTKRR